MPEDVMSDNRKSSPPRQGAGPRRLAVAAAVFAVAIGVGIAGRVESEKTLARETRQAARLDVAVVHPDAVAPDEDVSLPGTMEAFVDTPIYARTDGYLKQWLVDLGDHVTKGQLLAEIETPELDDQLRQARADLAAAQADLQLREITARRDDALLKSRAVSTQERDNAAGAYASAKALVESRQANVARLAKLQSFEKVYAPFSGVITARNVDVGQLITAGSQAPGRGLFHLKSTDRLRVFVSVPEVYSRASRPGVSATLTLDEFPGHAFPGKLVRTAGAIDPKSRTLLVEVDVDNPDGDLLPGAYAMVHLKLPQGSNAVTVPANTLLFRREGLQVGVVRDGKAELVPVKVGHDYGGRVEVVAGLKAEDAVILDPPDSLASGAEVQVVQPHKGGSAS